MRLEEFNRRIIKCGSPLGTYEVHLEMEEIDYIRKRLATYEEPRTDNVTDRGNQI